MNRRKFLLSSGSVMGGGILGYTRLAVRPSISVNTSVQTPNPSLFTNSIDFNISSFTVEGTNLPSGGTLTVDYKIEDVDRNKQLDSAQQQSNTYSGTSAQFTTSPQTLTIDVANVRPLNNHKLVLKITSDNSTNSFTVSEQSQSFKPEHVIINQSEPLNTDSSLVGWWPLHTSGSTAPDLSGNGNNGSVTGKTQVAGLRGLSAQDFDGSDDYVRTADSSVFDLSPNNTFTISYWVKGTATGQEINLAKYTPGGPDYGWMTMLNDGSTSDDKLNMFFRDQNGSSVNEEFDNIVIRDGVWHHIAVTCDGSNSTGAVRMWLDNVEQTLDSSQMPESGTFTNSVALYFGKRGTFNDFYFDGTLFGIRIYDRTLTVSEIQTLYQLGGGTI